MKNITSQPILQPYIKEGKVNYDKLRADDRIAQLISMIEETEPRSLSKDEEFAFWLNAYNIITVKAVLDQLRENPSWEGVKSVWDKFKFFFWNRHRMGTHHLSLFELENKILRQQFIDPRIHFAINCASRSCPNLPSQLFDGATLDTDLDKLSHDFINNQDGVLVENEKIIISRIFKFYSHDFGGEEKLIEFINQYWEGETIPQHYKIEYQTYDWSLNNSGRGNKGEINHY